MYVYQCTRIKCERAFGFHNYILSFSMCSYFQVARKLRLPVLLPSWVESCWGDGLKQVIYATHSTTLTPHQAPPFTGITITVTGLDEKARSKVKKTCSENGGKYSGELTKDVCTHLLVGNKSSKWVIGRAVPIILE